MMYAPVFWKEEYRLNDFFHSWELALSWKSYFVKWLQPLLARKLRATVKGLTVTFIFPDWGEELEAIWQHNMLLFRQKPYQLPSLRHTHQFWGTGAYSMQINVVHLFAACKCVHLEKPIFQHIFKIIHCHNITENKNNLKHTTNDFRGFECFKKWHKSYQKLGGPIRKVPVG